MQITSLHPSRSFNTIPEDLGISICLKLKFEFLKNLMLVSKRLNTIVKLTLQECYFSSISCKNPLIFYNGKYERVRRLKLHYTLTQGEFPGIIASFKNLRHLNLSSCEIPSSKLGLLRSLSLITLKSRGSELATNCGYEHFKPLTSLEVLELGFCKGVKDEDLRHLANLTNLRKLSLKNSTLITAKGIASLGLKKLKSLKIENSTGFSINGYGDLKVFAHLEKFRHSIAVLSCDKISGLAALTNLTDLRLYSCMVNSDIAEVSNLPKLRTFKLCDMHGFQSRYLSDFQKLTNLTSLSLKNGWNLVNMNMQPLMQMKNLHKLNLCSVPVTKNEICHLLSLSKLQVIKLNRNKINDEDIHPLLQMTSLTDLRLGETKITDASLKAFGLLPKLKVLDLSYIKTLGDEAINHLEKINSLTLLRLGEFQDHLAIRIAKEQALSHIKLKLVKR